MRILAFCPRIKKVPGPRVVATTALRVRILFLGSLLRKVVIDPSKETISIDSRYVWLIRRQQTIPFSDVQAVTYGYEDVMSHESYFSYGHDSIDWFTVGLRFHDESEKRLFNFIGEGTFDNEGPFPDWLYWGESAFDLSGSQDKESRVFADLLANLIGAEIVPPNKY